MKKVMKKSISVLMIVVMCLTMAPLQGFVGMDIGEWFASEAKANFIENGWKQGVLKSYTTLYQIDLKYDALHTVTIDDATYTLSENYKVKESVAKNYKDEYVFFKLVDGEIVKLQLRNNALKDVSATINFTVDAPSGDEIPEYENGRLRNLKITLRGKINYNLNVDEEYKTFLIEQNYLTLKDIVFDCTLSENQDVFSFYGGEKTTKIELDDEIISGGDLEFDVKVFMSKKYNASDSAVAFETPFKCVLSASNGYNTFNSTVETDIKVINAEKKDPVQEMTMQGLLTDMQNNAYRGIIVSNCDADEYKPFTGKKGDSNLFDIRNALSVLIASESFNFNDISFDLFEVVTKVAGHVSGNSATAEITGVFFDAIEDAVEDKVADIEKQLNIIEKDFVEKSEYFDLYIKWYCEYKMEMAGALKTITIACPVNVEIVDEAGDKILSVVDDTIVYCDSRISAYVTEVGVKIVKVPTDIDHFITITATDNGTMDYSVREYTPNGVERIVKYEDVPLILNEFYETTVPNENMLASNNYNLTSSFGEIIECTSDSLPSVEDNIADVIVAEELFDGFPVEIVDLVADTMFNMKSVVDLSAYDISTDDAVALFSAVAKYYPVEYSLIANSDFTYKIIVSPNLDRIMKIRFYYGDDANLSTYQKRVKDLNAEIDALVAKVEGMNEFEKALYIHDYIVLNSEYDLELLEYMEANNCILPGELRSEKYTEYSILVNGTGVCGSYALAYRAVLNAAGMECLFLSSIQMNHAWNLVKIDGKWYHVDCCWDDAVPDIYGRAERKYFLRTDDEIMNLKHYSWTPGKYKANSEKYSDMPRDYDIKQKYDDGKWYYLEGTTLYSSDEYGKNETEITSISASSIDAYNGSVYYSTGRYIYEYDIENDESSIVYMLLNKDSGERVSQARLTNIYVDDEIVGFYKSVYKNDKRITIYDTDRIEKNKYEKIHEKIIGITLSSVKETANVFDKIYLNADIQKTDGVLVDDVDIIWNSSDVNVATVDENGVVLCGNPGTTNITASILEYSVSCEVTVTGDGLSGMYGDDVRWSFDPISFCLSFSGSGAMMLDDTSSGVPWLNLSEKIKYITMSDQITVFPEYCFSECQNLISVKLSNSLETIPANAFSYCENLESIELPDSVIEIGNNAFLNCRKLKNFVFGSNLISIGYASFMGCYSLTELYLPDSLQEIGGNAFYGCISLKEIEIPKNVKTISDGSFSFCDSLERISVSKDNDYFSDDANGVLFNSLKTVLIQYPIGSVLEEYTVPEGVKEIREYAFSECKNIEKINISSTVTTLYHTTFMRCDMLEQITVDVNNRVYCSDNNGVLFNKAMSELIQYPDGSKNSTYSIPEGTRKFYTYSFYRNEYLKSIYIPKSMEIMGSGDGSSFTAGEIKIGTYLFYDFCGLEEIIVDAENKNFSSENGVLYSKDKSVLIYYPGNKKDLVFKTPDFVTSVSKYAFNNTNYTKTLIVTGNIKQYGTVLDYNVSEIQENSIEFLFFEDITKVYINTIKQFKSLKKLYAVSSGSSLNSNYDVCSDLSIYSTKNSSLEKFANEYGLDFTNISSEPHTHDYFLLGYSAPTETEDGYELWECYCREDSYKVVFHNYGEETTTEPSCVVDGNKHKTCLNCGEVEILETIPATGKHDYKLTSTIPGTCTTAPVHTYTCSACGDSYTKEGRIEEGHIYETTVIAPTCDEKGYTKEVCTVCGETTLSDFTSPKGHEFIINKSADYCSAHGTLEYACKNCDYAETVVSDKSELVTETVTVEPTCTKSGTKSEVCVLCKSVVAVEILNPLSHEYSTEYTVDKEPTCTAEGQKSQHCTRCDAKRAVTAIESTGHKNTGIINAADATCTTNGYTGDTFCYDCNTTVATGSSTEMLKHSYSSVVTAPTCTAKGYTTYTCTACGDTYTGNETAMLKHSYTSVVTPVSCTANGYTTYTCTVCSHSYNDNVIPSVGHSYNDNGTCTGCGKSRAENCTHMCHKSGFTGFIWKIVRFFLKLFKIQPVCSCGVKHW